MSPASELSERDELELLLPWYVTGRLDPTDRARVETGLASIPELRRQLELIRDEQEQSLGANERVRAPATLTVERTFDAVVRGGAASRAATGLLSAVRSFFAAPTASGVRFAAAAAAVVFLLQAATLGYLVSERPGGAYQPASGGPSAPATAGSYALVRFADSATARDIATTLGELRMSIVDGPREGGLYRVRISDAASSESESAARVAALRQKAAVVTFATPAP
jgi:hypothetical protein